MSWWSDRDFRPSTTKKVEKILDIIAEIAKAEYERGKEDEKRWWSGFCAKCTDIDREQGHWNTEYHGNGWNDYLDYTCSNCGKNYERADAVLYKANFCPNCGADMRKGVNDE